MAAILVPLAGSTIGFASFAGDPEAASYKRELMTVFSEAGWEVTDQSTFMFFDSKSGVVLTIPIGADELDARNQAAASALHVTGQLVGGNRGDIANETGRCVQVWPAPMA